MIPTLSTKYIWETSIMSKIMISPQTKGQMLDLFSNLIAEIDFIYLSKLEWRLPTTKFTGVWLSCFLFPAQTRLGRRDRHMGHWRAGIDDYGASSVQKRPASRERDRTHIPLRSGHSRENVYPVEIGWSKDWYKRLRFIVSRFNSSLSFCLFIPDAKFSIAFEKYKLAKFNMYTENTFNLIDDIKKEVSGAPGSPGHDRFHLLQLVDELKLSIETPTETVLRLIYQVNGTPYSRN